MLKLFYRAKRLKHEKQNNTLPLYTALLSMVLCMVCLAGTTWAWFTANQEVHVDSIITAEWSIDSVEVYQIASAGNAERITIPVDETTDGMEFEVNADTKYSVTVSTRGNSSTGYLYVETCDGDYYTTKSDIDFELLLLEGGTVTITASWGGYSGHAEELLEDVCIGDGEVHVCSCDTLCTDGAVNEDCEICKDSIENCNGSEENTQETSGSSETSESLETPEVVVDEETTESTDIITESTSESESEDTLDTEDIATDANAENIG